MENATVIHLVRTYKDLRQSTFNLLIINMAVADISDVCFATTVSVSFVFVGRRWIPGLAGLTFLLHISDVHRTVDLHARYYVC